MYKPTFNKTNQLILLLISSLLLLSIGCDKKEAKPEAPPVVLPEVISEKWLDPLQDGGTISISSPQFGNYLLTRTKEGWTIKSDKLGERAVPLRPEYSQQLEKIFASPVMRVPKTAPSTDLNAASLSPNDRVKFELKNGANPPLTFYVGATTEEPNSKEPRTYILSGDEKAIFQAKNDLGSLTKISPFQLRNNEVIRLDPDKIIKMESDQGDQAQYKLELRDGNWINMLHPDQPLELSLINGIKRQLSPLTAVQFLPDNTNVDSIPERDKRTFIVSDTDGSTYTLQFAKTDREGAPLYLVKVVNSGKVASIPESPLSYAFLTSADLRERRPRTFASDTIKEIRFPGTKPVVVRPEVDKSGELRWNQVAPEKGGPIGINHVQNSIDKAASVVPVRMSDTTLEAAGLTPVDPTEILELRLKDGTRKQLAFGKETERKDGRYVVWQDTTDVFVISDSDSKQLHPTSDTFLR